MRTIDLPIILLVFCAPLVAVQSAGATTWRVEKDGSGDFTVIQDAVDVAAAGDTILIGPGRYEEKRPFTTDQWTEDAYVGVSVTSLTLRGTDREAVIIGPTVPAFQGYGPKGIAMSRELTSYLRVENLTIENVRNGLHLFNRYTLESLSVRGCDSGVFAAVASASDISQSEFVECQLGVFSVMATDTGISRTRFMDNGWAVSLNQSTGGRLQDCPVEGGGGIQFSQGSTGTVARCSVSGVGALIRITTNSLAELVNCTIDNGNYYALVVSTASHVTGTNNRLRGGGQATILFSGNSTADFDGNHILRSTGPAVLTEAYMTVPLQIDLTGNYWGSSSASEIRSWILDGEDLHNPPFYPNYSTVLFEPFAEQPIGARQETIGALKGAYREQEE